MTEPRALSAWVSRIRGRNVGGQGRARAEGARADAAVHSGSKSKSASATRQESGFLRGITRGHARANTAAMPVPTVAERTLLMCHPIKASLSKKWVAVEAKAEEWPPALQLTEYTSWCE